MLPFGCPSVPSANSSQSALGTRSMMCVPFSPFVLCTSMVTFCCSPLTNLLTPIHAPNHKLRSIFQDFYLYSLTDHSVGHQHTWVIWGIQLCYHFTLFCLSIQFFQVL
ncbi:hypothetical protein KC19_10G184800 [Ceratodon purpureus]|uniref:Uncharacterized protein n=1 Tax=Ceratodon purpureus TaxID=3225 RepID=A0A8T0GLS8_CERPU|nr:hypothetical protein KC19_10G184800 [Ceratodon purpureus]